MKKLLIVVSLLFSMTLTSVSAKEVSLEAKITGLYVAFFNRAADQSGLEYWVNKAEVAQIQGGTISDVLKELSAGFAQHPTFISTYAELSNKEFVEAIYRNALGRDGDADGIAYWTNLLNTGTSRSDMVANFVEGSLVVDLTPENFPNLSEEDLANAQLRQDLITNKVNAALSFTQELGELTNVLDALNPESDPAYLASIQIISQVTEDDQTVFDVIAFIASILNSQDPIESINTTWKSVFTYDNGYLINSTGSTVILTDIKYHMVADLVIMGYDYHYESTFSYVDGMSGTYTIDGMTYEIQNYDYSLGELSIPIYDSTPLYYALPDYTFSYTGITGTVHYTYTFVTTGGNFTYTSTITYE